MTTKYTPGPWMSRPDQAEKHGGITCIPITDKDGFRVAWVNPYASTFDDNKAEANAAILAAAPELAEALRQALEALQSIASEEGDVAFWNVAFWNDGGKGRKACNSARHALQKAGLVF